MKYRYTLILFFCLFQTNSQTLEANLQKYWYYRERLKNDFMVVDNNNAQGTNIPAGRRYVDEYNETVLKWGDAEGYLGMYMMVLATEYKLLKDNQQDYSETLQELKNALHAFERLDKYAEYWWRDPDIHNLPSDINGFFIRDDVGSHPDSANYILNHPNSQLAQSGINKIESDFINDDDGGHPCEMSKDQVWLILPGLALVEELVDEPGYIIQDILGANVTFCEWARKITHRVISYCQGQSDDWNIYNTVTGDLVRRGPHVHEQGFGYEWPFHFGFAEAGNSITDQYGYSSLHCGSSSTNGTDFREAARAQASFKPESFYSFGSLISLMNGESSWQSLGWWGDEFTYYEFLRHVMLDVHWYEHFRLIRGIIHVLPDISYDDQAARQTYLDLLNIAPECGPFNFYYESSGTWIYPVYEWSSLSRLIRPEDLGSGNNKSGFYSGLDYMLLHNLFCLTYENFIHTVEPGEVYVESTDIVSSLTIPSFVDVDYIADRRIQFKPGFHAEEASHVNAYINPQSSNFSYRKVIYQPQCSYVPPQPATAMASYTIEIVPDSTSTDSLNNNEKSLAQETCSEKGINIYPNPGRGIFKIESIDHDEAISSIEIVNTLGQIVFSDFRINNSIVQIDISNQPKGIYFVMIISGDQIFNKQIIVQ
ncbi:MAG: T9SS type A sorting domain-containing protein [Bacteroidota bacterium]|nr:T9SS type A sorting domain-containing protein [Bacteroidota bacterium]